MNIAFTKTCLSERRPFFERRKFDYSEHIPERRSGKDRREDTPTVRDPWNCGPPEPAYQLSLLVTLK